MIKVRVFGTPNVTIVKKACETYLKGVLNERNNNEAKINITVREHKKGCHIESDVIGRNGLIFKGLASVINEIASDSVKNKTDFNEYHDAVETIIDSIRDKVIEMKSHDLVKDFFKDLLDKFGSDDEEDD